VGGDVDIFDYPYQVADDVIQMDAHETLNVFHIAKNAPGNIPISRGGIPVFPLPANARWSCRFVSSHNFARERQNVIKRMKRKIS